MFSDFALAMAPEGGWSSALELCYSKCGLQPSSITQQPVGNATSQTPPRPPESDSVFFLKRFILFVWERQNAHRTEGVGCRVKGREPQANSLPSMDPEVGLHLTTLRSWPEPKPNVRCWTTWGTQAPPDSAFNKNAHWGFSSKAFYYRQKGEEPARNGKTSEMIKSTLGGRCS